MLIGVKFDLAFKLIDHIVTTVADRLRLTVCNVRVRRKFRKTLRNGRCHRLRLADSLASSPARESVLRLTGWLTAEAMREKWL